MRNLVLALCALAAPCWAGEFMFMPTLAYVQNIRSATDPTLEKRQTIADFFYSGDEGRLRYLSELQLDRGGFDMERLQVGWRIAPELSLWFGRYHNPIGYWNIEHHHGHYMEVSAERPRILEFEDEGGPLPIHLMGFLLQGSHNPGDAAFYYDLGAASGPRVADEFEPVDVLRDTRYNKLALVARGSYHPDATHDDQMGAFVAHTRIPTPGLDFAEAVQDMAGVYVSRDFDRLRVFGEGFRIHHRLSPASAPAWPSYWAGYVQGEYKIVPFQWTVFARYEGVSRSTPAYQELFPMLPRQRDLAGVRWDFHANQALKVEYVRDATFDGVRYRSIEVQWSAMFM